MSEDNVPMLEFVGVTEDQLTQQREDWISKISELQTQLEKLMTETGRLQQQITMLNGAVQSCDFFLQGLKSSK